MCVVSDTIDRGSELAMLTVDNNSDKTLSVFLMFVIHFYDLHDDSMPRVSSLWQKRCLRSCWEKPSFTDIAGMLACNHWVHANNMVKTCHVECHALAGGHVTSHIWYIDRGRSRMWRSILACFLRVSGDCTLTSPLCDRYFLHFVEQPCCPQYCYVLGDWAHVVVKWDLINLF